MSCSAGQQLAVIPVKKGPRCELRLCLNSIVSFRLGAGVVGRSGADDEFALRPKYCNHSVALQRGVLRKKANEGKPLA